MNSFIFITTEGYTFQTNSHALEPDIENMQVLGFANGENAASAFNQLVQENTWLRDTSFNEIQCLELANREFEKHKQYFHLKVTDYSDRQ